MKSRMIGLAFVIVGLGLAYSSIYMPLHDAWSHVDKVTYFEQGPVIAVAGFIFGLIYLIGGDDAKSFLGDLQKRTPTGWAVIGIAVGLGFAAMFLLQIELRNCGYNF